MPIYEYKCQACGHEMEAIQKMSDPALIDCPQCQQAALKKLISAAGFQLKGNGWYATDFKNKTPAPQKKPAGDAPSAACGTSACPARND